MRRARARRRGKDDRRIERLRRDFIRAAGPYGADRARESLRRAVNRTDRAPPPTSWRRCGCKAAASSAPVRVDSAAQAFARTVGAVWAGGSDEIPPEPLDAAIIFAPVGALVPAALRAVKRGPRRMRRHPYVGIPSFPYAILVGGRQVVSVANLTRADACEFLANCTKERAQDEVVRYPLARANDALDDLRGGRLQGAAVLCV